MFTYHKKSRAIYRVLGEARLVKQPSKTYIVYESTEWSTDRDTGAELPPGTKWLREKSDFCAKFFRYGVSR